MGRSASLALDSGSRVGVIGGGPAGSFFSYFLLQLAQRLDIDVGVDIYEWRDFSVPGPAGCNAQRQYQHEEKEYEIFWFQGPFQGKNPMVFF